MYLSAKEICVRKPIIIYKCLGVREYSQWVNRMEKTELFRISRGNAEWLKENYDALKRRYTNRWIMIQNKKVVETASTFDEIMKAIKKYDPNSIMVEYVESDQIAMFF